MPRALIFRTAAGLALILFLGIGGYWRWQNVENVAHWGETMGTRYSVKISGKLKKNELRRVVAEIDTELAAINLQMSTWDPQSEISRFNHFESTEPFQCSEGFSAVVRRALELSYSSGGAFDPTLQPLLNLWGFGSEGGERKIPSDLSIIATRAITGWQNLSIDDSSRLRKSIPELSLALGAIAKGYGVDALARVLNQDGYENWFVEVGGEVVVRGLNPDGAPWRIGIEYPTTNPMDQRLQGILHLTGGAVATSGDYRNYISEDHTIYSHILDPRTGRAVLSDTASVTVLAPDCMTADGLATALFVMGPDAGLGLIEQRADTEAMFLVRDEAGEIFEIFSSGFTNATGYIPSH